MFNWSTCINCPSNKYLMDRPRVTTSLSKAFMKKKKQKKSYNYINPQNLTLHLKKLSQKSEIEKLKLRSLDLLNVHQPHIKVWIIIIIFYMQPYDFSYEQTSCLSWKITPYEKMIQNKVSQFCNHTFRTKNTAISKLQPSVV